MLEIAEKTSEKSNQIRENLNLPIIVFKFNMQRPHILKFQNKDFKEVDKKNDSVNVVVVQKQNVYFIKKRKRTIKKQSKVKKKKKQCQ